MNARTTYPKSQERIPGDLRHISAAASVNVADRLTFFRNTERSCAKRQVKLTVKYAKVFIIRGGDGELLVELRY